jgi:hypothetical protein
MNRNLWLFIVFGFRVSWISLRGSVVFCWVFSPVFLLMIVVCWFLDWMVFVGETPMKEYCASFFGPSIDSRK